MYPAPVASPNLGQQPPNLDAFDEYGQFSLPRLPVRTSTALQRINSRGLFMSEIPVASSSLSNAKVDACLIWHLA